MTEIENQLSVLHINTFDIVGGAAKVAWRLAEVYRKLGLDSKILAGENTCDSAHVFPFPIKRDRLVSAYYKQRGQLYYELQGSHTLVNHPLVRSSDVLHLHNLHGGYFNPFSILSLSHLKPTVWTLHDMQAITGHCAHSFNCQKWEDGCGQCPNLSIYPEIKVDTTRQLWRDKKKIYDNSYLTIVTPSQWLKNKVERSMLQDHPVQLIYNSVDTGIFRPYDRTKARKRFGIPADKLVIGAVAQGGALSNCWKGGNYTRVVFDAARDKLPDFVFVNIGARGPSNDPRVVNIPHISDERELAEAYSILDVFLYTPIADNCPLVVLEALSCGVPIVSFGTGGIPELVRNGVDGYVSLCGDVGQLLQALEKLVAVPQLRAEFGRNARESAVLKFDQKVIAKQYLTLYEKCLTEYRTKTREVKLFSIDDVPKTVLDETFVKAENSKRELVCKNISSKETELGKRIKVEPGNKLTILTSVSPKNVENQVKAIESWTRLRFDVVSVNCESEIRELEPSFPGVRFVRAKRDGRDAFGKPLIYFDDFLEYFKNADCEFCGIVNSDIHLAGDEETIDFLKNQAKNSLVCGSRIDIDSLEDLDGEFYKDGYDFFFFHKRVISCFPKSDFCMGMPWWDCWAAMIPILEGFEVKRLVSPFAYHIKHAIEWDGEQWRSLAERLYEQLRNKMSKKLRAGDQEDSWAFLGQIFTMRHRLYLREKDLKDDSMMSVGIIFPSVMSFLKLKSVPVVYEGDNSNQDAGTFLKSSAVEPPSPVGQQAASQVDRRYIVSAIVSTYNSERFIRGCLEDLENQTIAERLEIIVVDSGSEQNEEAIVKEFAQKYDNIKYIRTENRETIYKAWNRAIRAASGKYITSANTDDTHTKEALEEMVKALEANPDKVLVYANQMKVKQENGRQVPMEETVAGEPVRERLFKGECFPGSAPMWRRDVHDVMGYFDEYFAVSGDYEFWFRITQKFEILHLDKMLGERFISDCVVSEANAVLRDFENGMVIRRCYEYARRVATTIGSQGISGDPLFSTWREVAIWKQKARALFESWRAKRTLVKTSPSIGSEGSRERRDLECDVSIVVCTKDRADLLDQMFASLKEAMDGVSYEIIVVEGGSSDNTLEVLQKHGVTKIYNEAECMGLGRHSWPQLYNCGFSKASGKWAMYASDDIVFGKGCISRAIQMLKKQKEQVAGGVFFYKNVHSRLDWDKYGIDFTPGSKLLLNYGLVRLDYFRQVSGLDESYRFYCADSDLCYKLYEKGMQLIPLPGCFVLHNNVLDVQKRENMLMSGRDVELCQERWKHFIPIEVARPRRLLWSEDTFDAFNVPAELSKIDSVIEHFWRGLACYQKGLYEEAELEFMQAVDSHCDHWQVLWYLAKAADACKDTVLALKTAKAVAIMVPEFAQVKELLEKLERESEQAVSLVIDPFLQGVSEVTSDKDGRAKCVGVIFSKDRAMQLQATLESFVLHCGDSAEIELNVLYKTSNDLFRRQYERLRRRFGNVSFIEETEFKAQLTAVVTDFEHVLFLVDDNLFVREFRLSDITGSLRNNTDAVGFSLRLGRNTTYCYSRNGCQSLPEFENAGGAILKYDWTNAELDFGYSLEISSSVYRVGDILPLLDKLEFDNPNILEDVFANNTMLFAHSKPNLLCNEYSVTFCNPVNKVQSVFSNRAGSDHKYSVETLAERFEQGYAIDVEKYSGFLAHSCHQEVQLYFKKSDAAIEKNQADLKNWQQRPKFSIVMANYNNAEYISDAIESVLKQTFDDWELIIVEDCSTDNSLEVVGRYLADPRIKLIQHKSNFGYTTALKTGIANVQAEYFGILDSDDCLMPRAVETMYEWHVKLDNCGLIYSQFAYCGKEMVRTHDGFCSEIEKGKTCLDENVVSHFKTFKLRDYLKTSGYDERILYAEDIDIVYKMEEVTGIKFVDECLYLYRELPDSICHSREKVNVSIMSRVKARINAIKRRCSALAKANGRNFEDLFRDAVRRARADHGDVEQYFVILTKLYESRLLGGSSLPAEVDTWPEEERILWIAENINIEFEKLFKFVGEQNGVSEQPLVSVCMVTYNAEEFIDQAINSVLSQTYKNLELLIVDDGSMDSTADLVASCSDERIRYIRQEHRSFAAGINRAIAEAKGQYLINVDSDDFIDCDYIEKMLGFAKQHPEIDYFYPAELTLVDQVGNLIDERWQYLDFSDNRVLPAFLLANAYGPIPNPGSLKRRSLFDKVGLYEDLDTVEDFDFLCRNALKISFMRVPEHSNYFYRRRAGSNSGRFRKRNQVIAAALNAMVSLYAPQILCPQIADVTDPVVRRRQYFEYLMETFRRHYESNRERYGEYFQEYARYYEQRLQQIGKRSTTAGSAV